MAGIQTGTRILVPNTDGPNGPIVQTEWRKSKWREFFCFLDRKGLMGWVCLSVLMLRLYCSSWKTICPKEIKETVNANWKRKRSELL